MDSYMLILIKLYAPIALAILLCILLLARYTEHSTFVTLKLFGFDFLEFKLPVKHKFIIRVLLVAALFLTFSSYLFYDFTNFFPSHLKMDVFFDKEGIDNSLRTFSDKELLDLNVVNDYDQYRSIYYDDLDSALNKLISAKGFFNLRDGIVHSTGETDFLVQKVHGIQKYFLQESKGMLTHTLEKPNNTNIVFTSFFEKISSNNDYIEPPLTDIYFRHEVILRPSYKQIIAENYKSNGVTFHHTLSSITKVSFLPFPQYSRTVYLFKLSGVGYIPIAYANYR